MCLSLELHSCMAPMLGLVSYLLCLVLLVHSVVPLDSGEKAHGSSISGGYINLDAYKLPG